MSSTSIIIHGLLLKRNSIGVKMKQQIKKFKVSIRVVKKKTLRDDYIDVKPEMSGNVGLDDLIKIITGDLIVDVIGIIVLSCINMGLK